MLVYNHPLMRHLDQTAIKKLTQLSRIDCSEEEEEALLRDLEEILTYADQLQQLQTDEVSPCNNVIAEMHNVMRDDKVEETLSRDTFLNNAPAHTSGMVRVPPVITQQSEELE